MLSQKQINIINIIKKDFPKVYKEIDPDNKLIDEQLWNQIDTIIKESKSFHMGSDASGLIHLLSMIKNGYSNQEILEFKIVEYYNIYQKSYKLYKKIK